MVDQETAAEKKTGDANEAAGLNRDGSPKEPEVSTPGPRGGSREAPVAFNPAQIKVINKMLEDAVKGIRNSASSPNSPISLYNLRDPKNIETVKVSRFDAKWVIRFKDLQNDPYKKTPKYLRYGVDPIRKLNNEPYITLILSSDGVKEEEKEVLLVDYMENRDRVDLKVISHREKEVIHDHGILGQQNNYGVAIDDKGRPESRPTILAQSKSIVRWFTVQPEGFKEPMEFPTDFLA